MNHSISDSPFYVRFTIFMVGILSFGCFLYVSRSILIPLIFSVLFVFLLEPVVAFFQRIKIPRVVAIVLAVSLGFLLLATLVYFIIDQLALFVDSLPKFQEQVKVILDGISRWLSEKMHVRHGLVTAQFDKWGKSLVDTASTSLAYVANIAAGVIFVWLLVPVYVFLLLYSQPLIIAFIKKVSARKNLSAISDTLDDVKKVTQSYLVGLVIEAIIMSVLNSAALMILGLDYAIAIGVIGAILNIIPYIGGVVSVIIPMLFAIVTIDPFTTPLLVLLFYVVIQFVDNNFIMTFIVASRVRINALMSIVVVLIFGELFGIAGMFLAIPITGIVKIIFDRIEVLAPYGMLLGNEKILRKVSLK